MDNYTLGITSCGRFELLERTLSSLLPRLEVLPQKLLVIEDSTDRRVKEVIAKFRDYVAQVEVIINSRRLGQIRSIDKLFSHVETDWVFTCEDDWLFIGDSFLSASYHIMNEYDSCSTVSLSGKPQQSHKCSQEAYSLFGHKFFVANVVSKWPYGSYGFGPGLKRTRDWKIVGPYSDLSKKVSLGVVAKAYQDLGYRILFLEQAYISHLGHNQHVVDPAREKSGISSYALSTKKRLEQIHWALFPSSNPLASVRKRHEAALPLMKNWIDWRAFPHHN